MALLTHTPRTYAAYGMPSNHALCAWKMCGIVMHEERADQWQMSTCDGPRCVRFLPPPPVTTVTSRLQHDTVKGVSTVMSKQRKRRATDKAAQQKGQRKPPATKAAQQAKRLRFGSVGVRSNLGHPPPLSESAARRLYRRDTEIESSEDDEV